ncbi:hypothetical protein B0H10DRAFT_1917085 [Mycena sp. CBHHK59/15]|nr:hypothetical protein B0H10DRAFT_1917085 [Mycena sp. CBHHK59/15]
MDLSPEQWACPGVILPWSAGTIRDTYPIQLLLDPTFSLGYHLTYFEQGDATLWVASDQCAQFVFADGIPCFPCAEIHNLPRHRDLQQRATEGADLHTPYNLLSRDQMRAQLANANTKINSLKLEGLNLQRNLGRSLSRVSDYEQLVMAIANSDIPRLRQIVQQALDRNISIRVLLDFLKDAVQGVRRVFGYDKKDIDLAALVQHIGGRRLLYALNHEPKAALPSIHTMQRHRTFQYIRPCTGAITADYINYNLDAMFAVMDPKTRPLTGWSLLIDEISLQERARYYRWDNTIGGICREHAHLVNLNVDSAKSIQEVAQQVKDGVCHLGKEATVVAIASYGPEDYHARPIIVSVTDKTKKGPAQAEWMRILMDCWDDKWEDLLGPIFGFASDGDAVHRAAMHELFMGQLVEENSALWEFLGSLPGLNLQCDAKGRVADKDPKHLFKRK